MSYSLEGDSSPLRHDLHLFSSNTFDLSPPRYNNLTILYNLNNSKLVKRGQSSKKKYFSSTYIILFCIIT